MPITLNGDTGIQTPMYNGGITANAVTPSVNMKNRIINGAMVIDQRALGTVTVNSTVYTTDRWQANQTAAGKYSVANSTTAPAGFTNSFLATSLSAYSVGSSDIFFFQQNIEGYNVADLGWGTVNAKTITLSFWVRSSLTGTFGGALANSAHNRSYPFSYTISVADTWEQKLITVTGDTTGTWLTDNGIGIQVIFGLGGGSTRSGTAGSWQASTLYTATGATSVVGVSGATLFLTGVQLEVGSTATSFDYRPYGTELALCQRYYWKTSGTGGSSYPAVGAGGFLSATNFSAFIPYPVQMRATPTFSLGTSLFITTSGFPSITSINQNYGNQYSARLEFNTSTSVAGYGGAVGLDNPTTSFIAAAAEL